MSRKKSKSDMSVDELIQLAQDLEAAQARRNARRREHRAWLKNAPREETALRYRGQEKPCSISIYLQAERRLLRWLPDFPDLQGDAMRILLTLAHSILHLLHPEKRCSALALAECPMFNIHEICQAAIDIGFNYRPDPAFKLTFFQTALAMTGLTQGLDRERLHFDTLLGDLQIDL